MIKRYLTTEPHEREVLDLAQRLAHKRDSLTDIERLEELYGYRYNLERIKILRQAGYSEDMSYFVLDKSVRDKLDNVSPTSRCLEDAARIQEEVSRRKLDGAAIARNVIKGLILESLTVFTVAGGLRFIPNYEPTYKRK